MLVSKLLSSKENLPCQLTQELRQRQTTEIPICSWELHVCRAETSSFFFLKN